MGAELDTGKVDGVKTESNRVLTYAAVADMINANNTVVVYKGSVNHEVISISKVSGNFLSGKTINELQSYAIAQFTNKPGSSDNGGGVFTGILYAINNGAPLVGSVFSRYSDNTDGISAYVYANSTNNFTMWSISWSNILGIYISDNCEVIFQLHLKYD